MVKIPPEGGACRTCGQWREQRDFYLRNERTGNRFSQCRYCRGCTGSGGVQDSWYRDRAATGKRCRDCKQVLPINAFYLINVVTGQRRPCCGPCHGVASREFKQANREHVRAQSRSYYAANPEAVKERIRVFRMAHPERYHAIHSGWKKRNPEAVRAMGNKRRMLETAAPGEHYSAAEWKAMKARYDHRCLMCCRQEPTIRLTVDHIVPVSRGGSNSIDNLQPLCKSCNSKKYRTTVDLRPLEQAAFILE